ncbi:hypothetical protein Axi01nite_16400 [Actinoplanes xinjiangensis]|nr:hypothetical protein Axi01nite_16400 [Actinoplanes xinjiangensis]
MEAMGGAGPEAPSVLGGSLSPLGWSLGFLEAPSELVLPRLRAWRDDLGMPQKVRRAGTSWPGCLHALEPLTTQYRGAVTVERRRAWHPRRLTFRTGRKRAGPEAR